MSGRSALRGCLLGALLISLACSACSTPEPVSERFQLLNYSAKSVFLAYYPFLSADQKNELLAYDGMTPRELVDGWREDKKDLPAFEERMGKPENRTVTDLAIRAPGDSSDASIMSGTRVPLRAFATYANRQEVEITPDTDWRVDSKLAHMEKNELVFDCVNSDITVIADFLGERENSRTFEIRKPIESLELKVSEAYLSIDQGYNFKMVLIAHCEDGTSSDVSCSALWQSQSEGGSIEGCGEFVVRSREKLASDSLIVSAAYGGKRVKQTLSPPVR